MTQHSSPQPAHPPQAEPEATPAPSDAPTTAYAYRAGDRGAAATAHERQQREVLRGPSREDAASGQPHRSDPDPLPRDIHGAVLAASDADPTPADPPSSVQGSAAGQDGGREERIRAAAYALAAERGFAPGRALDDWLQAERAVDGGGQAAGAGDAGAS